jgi:hypothetical protein
VKKSGVLSAVVACVLTACSGGDPAPVGYWHGLSTTGVNSSTGYNVSLAILENGETWGVYDAVLDSGTDDLIGGLYGTTTSSASSLSGSGSAIAVGGARALFFTPATYSGTFDDRGSMTVTTSTGVTFTASYQPAYDQPVSSMADVAGTFNGSVDSQRDLLRGLSISVDATGAFTLPSYIECGGGSGTLTPRASGKNIFDVSITVPRSDWISCSDRDWSTATGVAYYDAARRHIWMMALNPAKTEAFMFVGDK